VSSIVSRSIRSTSAALAEAYMNLSRSAGDDTSGHATPFGLIANASRLQCSTSLLPKMGCGFCITKSVGMRRGINGDAPHAGFPGCPVGTCNCGNMCLDKRLNISRTNCRGQELSSTTCTCCPNSGSLSSHARARMYCTGCSQITTVFTGRLHGYCCAAAMQGFASRQFVKSTNGARHAAEAQVLNCAAFFKHSSLAPAWAAAAQTAARCTSHCGLWMCSQHQTMCARSIPVASHV